VEMALASYPGFFMTSPPSDESQIGVYWPTLVPSTAIEQRVVIGEESIAIPPVLPPASFTAPPAPTSLPAASATGPTRDVPLGTICGARSGDKGGNGNVGIWVKTPDAYRWLAGYLTAARLRELLPEARTLEVDRFEFPNLLALNFVVKGLLGDGVAASLRSDPQAKSLGEYLRAKVAPIPVAFLG
jgi:hypothetical protein